MTIEDYIYLISLASLIIVLILSSKEDLETHIVSRNKQLVILGFCIPLIILNWKELYYVHVIYIMIISILYYLGMGGADVKTLVPLSLTLPIASLLIFTILFNIFGLIHGYWLKSKKVPLIPSITAGYVLTLLWII